MYCFIEMELSLIVKIKSQAGSQLDRVYSSYLKSVSLCRLFAVYLHQHGKNVFS